MSFPADDYTPFGYLNVPGHTSRVNPKGVLRGGAVGFSWHAPAFAAGYGGRRVHYRAGLQLPGLEPSGIRVDHHSSAIFSGVANVLPGGPVPPGGAVPPGGKLARVTWFAIGDDVLVLRVEGPTGTRIDVAARYDRVIAASGQWGESGLLARRGRPDDDLDDATAELTESDVILQSFEDGEAFAIRGGHWTIPERISLGERDDEVGVAAYGTIVLDAHPAHVIMARGRTAAEAGRRLATADPDAALAVHTAADEAFWAGAPTLSGDWPEHWRRGVVYDLETLRMMVREPVGRYRHRWDAMQIQAPRIVLAEAAMDALSLSWADPELAAELLLGTMTNLDEPQVPCSREDGTFNMVAADGTVCGTGPQWGYPFLVAERLDRRLGRPGLRAALYDRLAALARFWRDHRRGPDGWLGFACSWESGQDLSPRFGDQPWGGGHPTRHVRPVDLYAALIHATDLLTRWAGSLAPDECGEWQAWRRDLVEQLGQLWTGERYADATSDGPTDLVDVMHLSPEALGVAPAETLEATQRAVAALDATELVWPMFVWTPVLAARRVGRPEVAGALAAAIIDRAYRHWDRRDDSPDHTLPGIACEYWPAHGRCGGEGYGWGAFTTELLFGEVIGMRLDPDGVLVRPALPAEWRGTYTVHLATPAGRGTLTLRPGDGGAFVLAGGAGEGEADGSAAGLAKAGGRWCRFGGPGVWLAWSELV